MESGAETGEVVPPVGELPGWVVDAAWLEPRLGAPDLRVIQVGGELFHRQMRIPGALLVEYRELVTTTGEGGPLGMMRQPGELRRVFGRLGIGPDTCVVACDVAGGMDASRLVWTLAAMGHRRAALLDGGMWEWAQRRHRWEGGEAPAVAPVEFAGEPDPECLASLELVQRLSRGEHQALLIDTRSPSEYQGDSLFRQGGHIAGAVHRNWIDCIESPQMPRLRERETLERLFTSLGAGDRQGEVVLYCRSAHRASHTWVVMRHLGYERVRLFDGSILLWDAHALPKVTGNDP